MADISAVTSTITTLVIKAFTISNDIYTRTQEIIDAPQHIQAITGDLEDFYSILGTLKMYLEEDGDLSAGLLHSAGRTNLEKALDNCLLMFDRINQLVGSYKARGGVSISTWRKIKYSFKTVETEALRSELAAHKLSLNIAISLVNFLNTNLRNAAAQRTEAEITTHIRHMEEKLPIILQNIEEIKAAALSSGEGQTSGGRRNPTEAFDVEVRSYLEQETSSISAGFRTPAALSIKTRLIRESHTNGTSSSATSTYHSALSYNPPQTNLQTLPENCTQVFVKGPTKKTHVLQVEPHSTLDTLKEAISSKAGVPAHLLFFVRAGKVLPSNRTLEDLNIPHDSTLFCNVRAVGKSNYILVKLPNERWAKMYIRGGMTIWELKLEIISRGNIVEDKPPARWISCGDIDLIFGGKKLSEDHKSLSDYGITGGSTLKCALRRTEPPSLKSDLSKLGSELTLPKRRKIILSRVTRAMGTFVAAVRGWPPIERAKKVAGFRSGRRRFRQIS